MFTEVHRIETCGYTLNVDRRYDRTTMKHTFEVLVTRNGIVEDCHRPFSSKAEAVACATELAAEYEARMDALVCAD